MTAATEGAYRIPWAPICYAVAALVAVVLHALLPVGWITGPLADILFAVGWLVVAAAIVVGASAVRALSRARTTIVPHRASEHLVTSGPYAFTRNPIYLAAALAMIGIGLIGGIPWLLIGAIAGSAATQRLAIIPEERHLFQRFGKRYHDYTKRVRRWL